jgi:hypothetical protein
MMTTLPRLALHAIVVAVSVACAADADAGASDDEDACPFMPEPSDPCLPACGNELGVGQPCTKDGFECPPIDVGNEATFCTVDFDDTDLAFCTRPCFDDADCGTDAVCTGDPEDPDGDKGCFPASCL